MYVCLYAFVSSPTATHLEISNFISIDYIKFFRFAYTM